MKTGSAIRDYAIDQMNHLLTSLAYQVHRTAKTPGPEQIHDLRVSIRRFAQGLKLFESFFPKWEVKKVRRMLKRMMRLTAEIRNRDITLVFLAEEAVPDHRRRVERERQVWQRQFSEMVRRWTARDFSSKWRNALSLRRV